jgi:hypothetical protein
MRVTPKLPSAEEVWGYPTRTLSQTKFPFWSAIITQEAGSVPVPGAGIAYVVIQPPVGETWIVDLLFALENLSTTTGSYTNFVQYEDFNGSTARRHALVGRAGVATYKPYQEPLAIQTTRILTNTLYARISGGSNFYSNSFSYGYSGFKLSQPLWTPRRLTNSSKPWKKPTTLTLPDPIKPLQKYAYEIVGLDPSKPDEYVLGVILEEDTPLAVDPDTGFPVERLTVVTKADDLAKIISGIKAGTLDPVAMGYKKYLDRWASEGIKL